MAGKNTAVFGIYTSVEHAERAVDTLIAAGFANGAISVLTPDTSSTREFAHHKDTKAPEGTTAGVTTGGVIGGTTGVPAPASGVTAPPITGQASQERAVAPTAVQGIAEQPASSTVGLAQPGPDGVSTRTVEPRPCGTAAHETDGTTTCVGIPGNR